MAHVKAEREWQAEDDFRSLTSAEEVRRDRKRLTRAKSAGRRIVRDAEKALALKRDLTGGRSRRIGKSGAPSDRSMRKR